MALKLEFDLELLNTETPDETLRGKMAEINKALGPLSRAYGEVKRQLTAIDIQQLKERWEAIKKQIKAVKQEIEEWQKRKDKLHLSLEEAMQRSVDAEKYYSNVVRYAPKESDYLEQHELDAYNKKVSEAKSRATTAGMRAADIQSEYQRVIQQTNRDTLDKKLRPLMQEEMELREQIKKLENKPKLIDSGNNYGLSDIAIDVKY